MPHQWPEALKGRISYLWGVSLQSVDMHTMESRVCKNLYFAGEVLDIDAITGGYNFQAAWKMGFVADRLG